jgi:hypothetical protein
LSAVVAGSRAPFSVWKSWVLTMGFSSCIQLVWLSYRNGYANNGPPTSKFS